MNKADRPVNVGITDLMKFKWPLTALVSISHRIAGVVLFVGIGFALWALQMSLESEAGYSRLVSMMASPVGMFIVWGLLAALAWHFVAGIKHLLMDTGVGETLEGGLFSAKVVILVGVILIFLAGVWVIQS